mmetsp:Transcript_53878/g.60196  ORF Transcript_53878/g.60196 Transcript_53878/m.60196 type:complete len:116 (-) Transcript_53878:1252-1599(-)
MLHTLGIILHWEVDDGAPNCSLSPTPVPTFAPTIGPTPTLVLAHTNEPTPTLVLPHTNEPTLELPALVLARTSEPTLELPALDRCRTYLDSQECDVTHPMPAICSAATKIVDVAR